MKSASMMYDIQKKKPALNIKEGIFYNDIEGYSIKVAKKSFDGKTLEDIIIYDHTSSMENDKVIVAKKGEMNLTKDEKFLELKLFDGHSYYEVNEKKNKNNPHRITRFKTQLIRFDLSSFSIMKNSEKLYKGHYAMLNVIQLRNAIDSLKKNYNNIYNKYNDYYLSNYNKISNDTTLVLQEKNSKIKYEKQKNIALNKLKKLKSRIKSNNDNLRYKKIIIEKHKIELHRKISLAYACFVFFLIGAPLGSIIRKGGLGIPVLIAVMFFIFYHIVSMIGERAAQALTTSSFEGMWLANIILTPVSFILIYMATQDTRLINLYNYYLKLINYTKKSN